MTRELLILRHAKSDWESGAASDFDRPLDARGKRDAPRVGAWMHATGLVPDQILSSPAKRARQTAKQVAKQTGRAKQNITWEPAIYGGTLTDLLGALAGCSARARTVLLVGHNPGLEELLRYLAGPTAENPPDGKLLPTATLARLEMPSDWQRLDPGCGRLLSITRPRALTS